MIRKGCAQGSLWPPTRVSCRRTEEWGLYCAWNIPEQKEQWKWTSQRIFRPTPNPSHAHPEASWAEWKRILSRFLDRSVQSEKVSSLCRFWKIPEPRKAEVTWSSSGGSLSALIRESNIVWKQSLHLSSNLVLLQDLGVHRPRPCSHSLPALQRLGINTSSPNRWRGETCPDCLGCSALHLHFHYLHHLSSKGRLVILGFHTFKRKYWLNGDAAALATSSLPVRYPQGLAPSKEKSSLDSSHWHPVAQGGASKMKGQSWKG